MGKVKFFESGIVLLNKPAGISSNTAVNIVRHSLCAKKCGHLGTLDLEGEGLLPVTVNGATKLFDFFLNKDKTYKATFVFGFETDTLDLAGKVVKEKECNVTMKEIESACKLMIGKQLQMPPLYSAKKVNGQVAYKAALKGEKIALHPKEIEIYDLMVLGQKAKNTFEFEISCSSGTYIRSLCRDLAEKLGTYGSMQCILRTRCGNFHLEDAQNLEEIKRGKIKLISCESVFDLPKMSLTKNESEKLLNGQVIEKVADDGEYKLFDETQFLGIGELKQNKLKIKLRLV